MFAAYEVVRRRDDGLEIRFGMDHDGRVVSACGVAPGTVLGRDMAKAEQLIARRAIPSPGELADPSIGLRDLGLTPR
jgi:3-phenylpropionate/trans-cinnamate dioxygenase ferredoxin reductase component